MEGEPVSSLAISRRRMLKAGIHGAAVSAIGTNGAAAQAPASGRTDTGDKETRRRKLYGLLGELPDRNRPISARLVSTEETETYTLEKLVLSLNGIQPVPAYFARPRQAKGRIPAVLFNHSHFGQYHVGKNELKGGRDEMQKPPYAEELARHGWAAICIDAWGFGERRGQTESQIFKQMLWTGRVMWGMMVYDNLQALDYLTGRPEVDQKRIATMGMSMGSTMSWWLAALDTRITVCVDICCLTDYDALIEANGLDLHGIYYYVPNLLKHFTAAQINALISPRPHLGLAGRYDPLTPYKGLMRIDAELREAYRRDGAPEAWKLNVYDISHYETAEMRADILEFFEKWM